MEVETTDKEKTTSSKPEDERVVPLNPTPFLRQLHGKEVIVRLKWGMEYKGKLTCADAYMNLRLSDAEEYIDGESHGYMSELLIRCNNILYIREKEQEDETEE